MTHLSFFDDVFSVAQSCPTRCNPMVCSRQAPLSTEFSRQECWRGLPHSTPGDLPYPGIEPVSLASPALADRFFATAPPESSKYICSTDLSFGSKGNHLNEIVLVACKLSIADDKKG